MIRQFLAFLALATVSAFGADAKAARPNIVLLYADDLGFGDVSCYGAKRVQTPNIDRVAAEGLRFIDAHSASATCTPSRYALLTGEYAFRKKGTGVLPGDAPLIIDPGRETIASVLHRAGYRTGVVGKWHLGLGRGKLDWNGAIAPGPLELGFDTCFLMPATGDRVPCVYVEDHRVVGLDPADPLRVSFAEYIGDEPTGKDHPERLRMHPSHGHDQTILNGISRIGYMTGGKSARWKDESMADEYVRRARAFVEKGGAQPFFLYLATHDIHVPRVPHPRFAGKSGMGPRGDVILEFDWCVGEIMKLLRQRNLDENTLVIISSDNGPVVDDGYRDQAREKLGDHKPAGPWRGGKYSVFEGGTRVPFIVRWKGRVSPGISRALVCQVDLLASLASLVGEEVRGNSSPDSRNVMESLLGRNSAGRTDLVEHAGTLAIRKGPWKWIQPGRGQKKIIPTNTETGNDTVPQLYNLDDDPGELRNLAEANPGKASELSALLASEKAKGMPDGR